jgi:hypothetical protein
MMRGKKTAGFAPGVLVAGSATAANGDDEG